MTAMSSAAIRANSWSDDWSSSGSPARPIEARRTARPSSAEVRAALATQSHFELE